jgi:hypothetical protein
MFVSYLSGCGPDYVRKTKFFQGSMISANTGAGNKKPGRLGCRVFGVRQNSVRW